MAAFILRAGILSLLWTLPVSPAQSHRQPVEWGAAIQRWLVLDPLPAPPDGISSLDREVLKGEATLSPEAGHMVSGWGMRLDPATGRNSFPQWRSWFGPRQLADDETGFWYAELTAPKEGRAKLVTAMSGSYLAWWNGFPVAWSRDENHPVPSTRDVVLRPGINRILVKGDRFGSSSPLVQLAPPGANQELTVIWNLPVPPDAEMPDLRVEWLDSSGKVLVDSAAAALPFPVDGHHPRWKLRGWNLRHHSPAGAATARWTLSRAGLPVAVKNTAWPCASPLRLGPESAVPWEVELRDGDSGAPVTGATFHDLFKRRADVLGPGRYRLMEWDVVGGTIECRGDRQLARQFNPQPGGSTTGTLPATALRLAGMVIAAEDGKPLAGARVQEPASWPTQGISWNEPHLTDTGGRFDFPPPYLPFSLQPMDLRISAQGYVPARVAITPGKPLEQAVALRRGRELSGRFTLAGSGEPGSHVIVFVKRHDKQVDHFATDADGRFITWLAETDGVTLEADAAGGDGRATIPVPDTGAIGMEWTLEPPGIPGNREAGPPRMVDLAGNPEGQPPTASDTALGWWLAPADKAALTPEQRRQRADDLLAAWIPPVEVRAAIAALSSEDFAKREAATRQLAMLGKAIHRELEAARAGADPETVQRINTILSAAPAATPSGWHGLDPHRRTRLLRRSGGDLIRLLGDDFVPWGEGRIERLGQARLEGPVPDANPLTVIFREFDRQGRRDLVEKVIWIGSDPAACQAADAIALSGDWKALETLLAKLPPERLAACPGLAAKTKAFLP